MVDVVGLDADVDVLTAAATGQRVLAGVQRELLAGFDEAEEARLRDFLARIYANTRAMPGS